MNTNVQSARMSINIPDLCVFCSNNLNYSNNHLCPSLSAIDFDSDIQRTRHWTRVGHEWESDVECQVWGIFIALTNASSSWWPGALSPQTSSGTTARASHKHMPFVFVHSSGWSLDSGSCQKNPPGLSCTRGIALHVQFLQHSCMGFFVR